MRWERVERRGMPAGTKVGALMLGAAIAGAGWLALGLPWPVCRLRAWTGIPCPSCGSTRMVEAIYRGDPAGAFLHNPLLFVTLTVLALWSLVSTARYLLGRDGLRPVLGRGERLACWLLALVALLANWLYLAGRGG